MFFENVPNRQRPPDFLKYIHNNVNIFLKFSQWHKMVIIDE